MSIRSTLIILGLAGAALIGGYYVALFLLPYPAILVLVSPILIFYFFRYALVSGAHLLVIVATMIGFVIMPVIAKILPELAVVAIVGLLTNYLVAFFVAWLAFLLLPAPSAPHDPHHHGTLDHAIATELAWKMTLIAAPLLAGFLLFGWSSILVLVYGTLFATALGSEKGAEMGWEKGVSNLIYGAGCMLLFYEIMVAAPNILVFVVLSFLAMFIFATRIFSGNASAPLWLGGFFGFLILTNSVMLSDKVVPSAKALDRILQIGIATLYVVFAYRVVELARYLFTKSR